MVLGAVPEPLRDEPPEIVAISPQHHFHHAAAPAPRTSFFGRVDEVERVRTLLTRDNVPLVTLTGPGGVGKTRTAVQAVLALPDGEWSFVDLSEVQQPGLVLPQIATVLGIHAGSRAVLESLKTVFRDDNMLLVLDNFEQVLRAASDLAELLRVCPRLQLLVTSRAMLGIPGEHVVDIRPFPLPEEPDALAADFDVCQLFADRARSIDPEFALDARNARTIVSICQRLDGLPLAVELAAAWLTVLSPDELLSQLEHRLSMLDSLSPGLNQRHRTMRDTIAWSYGLLRPQTQMLFRSLSVFVGGWTLDAAMKVCGDSSLVVLRELRLLIANSLVRRASGTSENSRYVMLETVRDYGLECLEASDEGEIVRQRYADYVLALTEQVESKLNTEEREFWLDRLESEQGNLHNVLEWAIARQDAEFAVALSGSLLPFWQFRFHSRVGQTWVQRALALEQNVSDPVLRKALYCAGTLAYMNGAVEEAKRHLADALNSSLEAEDQPMAGRVESALGRIAWDQGDLNAARSWYDSAKARLERSGDEAGLAQCLHYMGLVAYTAGDTQQATISLHEALAMWQSLGFTWELTCCTPGHLADIARMNGNFDEAMSLYQDCLSVNWDRHDLENVAWSLVGLAAISHVDGEMHQATRLMALADQFRERTGAPLTPHIDRDHLHMAKVIVDSVGPDRFAAVRAEVRNNGPEPGIAAALQLTRTRSRQPSTLVPEFGLTQRELQVLRLLAAGKSNREIAADLFVSPGTVKVHVTHILAKLDLPSRSAATDYAHRHGMT